MQDETILKMKEEIIELRCTMNQRYQEIEDTIKEMPGLIANMVVSMIKDKSISSPSSTLILDSPNGAFTDPPLTFESINRLLEERHQQFLEDIKNKSFSCGNPFTPNCNSNNFSPRMNYGFIDSEEEDNDDTPFEYKAFEWGGKVRCFPEDFVFPSLETKSMWKLWYFGDRKRGLHPFKVLQEPSKNCLKSRAERTNLSRTYCVMKSLEEIAVNKKLMEEQEDISSMPRKRAFDIFHESFKVLSHEIYGPKMRKATDANINTIANHLYKANKKRKHSDLDGDVDSQGFSSQYSRNSESPSLGPGDELHTSEFLASPAHPLILSPHDNLLLLAIGSHSL